MTSYKALLTIFSPDRVGLISEVTSHLFNQGINLGDTSFSILGKGGEFSSIIDIPDHFSENGLGDELRSLNGLQDANVDVKRLSLPDEITPSTEITHHIRCEGEDQPGLLARLSEVFTDFDGNIVRLKSDHMQMDNGWYFVTHIAVSIPQDRAANCLATLSNTAEGLGQKLFTEAV